MSSTQVVYTPDHTKPPHMQYRNILMQYLKDIDRPFEPDLFKGTTNINQVKKRFKTTFHFDPPAVKTTAGRITQGKMKSKLHYVVKDIPTNRYWLVRDRYAYEWPELVTLFM